MTIYSYRIADQVCNHLANKSLRDCTGVDSLMYRNAPNARVSKESSLQVGQEFSLPVGLPVSLFVHAPTLGIVIWRGEMGIYTIEIR
jgi:hypothetical protein